MPARTPVPTLATGDLFAGCEDIYIHTASGQPYWPFRPTPEMVDIQVVAHHLANQCRWAGATQHRTQRDRIFYSVAEHSLYVSDYLERDLNRPDLALEGLLHDAPEAFIQDWIRPIKYAPVLRAIYQQIEEPNERAVATRFSLQWPWPPEVKIADEAVCRAERDQIIPLAPGTDWNTEHSMLDESQKPAPITIEMLAPHQAKRAFLARFERLIRVRETMLARAAR